MASTGWFNKLKNWQQFHNIKFTREMAGSDALAVEHFPGILEKMLKKVVIQPSSCSTQMRLACFGRGCL
jgi:hypothetical protein